MLPNAMVILRAIVSLDFVSADRNFIKAPFSEFTADHRIVVFVSRPRNAISIPGSMPPERRAEPVDGNRRQSGNHLAKYRAMVCNRREWRTTPPGRAGPEPSWIWAGHAGIADDTSRCFLPGCKPCRHRSRMPPLRVARNNRGPERPTGRRSASDGRSPSR